MPSDPPPPSPVFSQVVLGYTQEGNRASAHDRYWGVEVGVKSASWIIKTMEKCGAKEGNFKGRWWRSMFGVQSYHTLRLFFQ